MRYTITRPTSHAGPAHLSVVLRDRTVRLGRGETSISVEFDPKREHDARSMRDLARQGYVLAETPAEAAPRGAVRKPARAKAEESGE